MGKRRSGFFYNSSIKEGNVMRFILLPALILLLPFTGRGQQTFTEHLKEQKAGQGKVVIVQNAEIESLVNGTGRTVTTGKKGSEEHRASHVSGPAKHKSYEAGIGGTRQRYKAQGYRIQIFTGGNSRTDKLEAQKMERKCQSAFPELSVYTHFVSPRWICRVGDFRTLEEAHKYARLIRAAGISYEVRPVKCTVLLAR